MGGMTMGFKAPATGVPPGVREGVRVDFEFAITPKGEFQLSSIAPSARRRVRRGASRPWVANADPLVGPRP